MVDCMGRALIWSLYRMGLDEVDAAWVQEHRGTFAETFAGKGFRVDMRQQQRKKSIFKKNEHAFVL